MGNNEKLRTNYRVTKARPKQASRGDTEEPPATSTQAEFRGAGPHPRTEEKAVAGLGLEKASPARGCQTVPCARATGALEGE